jgi:hypothetical protein
MKLSIKQCQDLNSSDRQIILDTLINDNNVYKSNKYNIMNTTLFNARINKTRVYPTFYYIPHYDTTSFLKPYYDFVIYSSKNTNHNDNSNKIIGYFTLNDILIMEIYKNNLKDYIIHPKHYFYSLNITLLEQYSAEIINILKYIIQYFQNIVKKHVKTDIKVAMFLDIDYNNKLLTPQIITETTKFKYYGIEKNNYDLKCHIFKLNLNDIPESTKLYSKKYLVSRQHKFENTLNDSQLITNLHNMKLTKNEDTYCYFDSNMVIFLHIFESRVYFRPQNITIMPIYIMNIMNNGNSLKIYYYLYMKMIKFNKKYLNEKLEPCYKLSSTNLFDKHIDKYSDKNRLLINTLGDINQVVIFKIEDINKYENKVKQNSSLEYYYIIDSNYEMNMLKYEDCFTLIMFLYVVSIINNEYKTYVYDTGGFLVFDKNNKRKKKYFDENIKDTYNLDLSIRFFPDDLNNFIDTNKYFSKVKNILKDVSIAVEDEIFPFRNVANSFQAYNCFFIINKNNHDPILMDIRIPEYCDYFSSKHTIFAERYFNWLNDIIYKPLLNPGIYHPPDNENLLYKNKHNFS